MQKFCQTIHRWCNHRSDATGATRLVRAEGGGETGSTNESTMKLSTTEFQSSDLRVEEVTCESVKQTFKSKKIHHPRSNH